jgi:probable rRNA maturation factor
MLKINLINQTEEAVLPWLRWIRVPMKTAYRTLRLKGRKIINVVLTTDEAIREINNTYRKIDKPTDVISFENDDSDVELGDVFISVQRARSQSVEYGHRFEREIAFLSVHGFLHCCGYDHLTKEDEAVMFSLQDQILDRCRITR